MKNKSNAAQRGSDIASNRFPAWKKATLASAVALTTLSISLDAQALALGAITVRSALGEPLRAEIEVPQISSEEASSFQARIASQQAFRSVGVDYTAALTGARLTLERRANGQAYLRLTGERPINEPFLGIVIEANWANGRMVRDYTMLVDPPSRPQAAAPVVAPQAQLPAGAQVLQAPAPAPAPIARPSVAEQTTPGAAAAARAAQRARAAEATQSGSSAAGGGGQVTVRRGDTAYGLAAANLPAGVSLDQMLMAMLRANPGAFMRGNVNYMKAGVVLDMPSAEQASAISRSEARQAVVAQSRDFREFRRGLAQSAPSAQVEASGRSASGRVSASVRDSAPAPATPDRLTISKGAAGAASAPSSSETSAARTRQAQEQADRIAELNRNIAELSRLQGTAAPGPAPSTPPTAAPAPAAATAPVPSSAGGTAPIPSINVPTGASPAASAAAANAANAAATAAASTVAANASAQAASSADAAALAASKAATATAAAAASSAPTPAPKPPAPARKPAPPLVEEPSLLDSLTENPLVPLAGGGLLALLLGYGLYRSRRKKEADGQFDSTLTESRPQGDSFFGSSGGRRVDTTNRTSHMGNQSSMIYSPSQIDAAGDVDPVAEADVYLAYGRDMQAEEILKEALRSNPTRLSIHRKLAEIYLKRRDARALEAIATEANEISGGAGGDWAYIRGLGSQIDADNPLYASESNLLASDDAEFPRRPFSSDTGPMPTRLIDEKGGLPSSFSALDLDLESAPVKADEAKPVRTTGAGSMASGTAAALGTTAAATGAAAAAAAFSPKEPNSAPGDLVSPISVMPPLDFDLDLDIAAAAEFASSEPMTLDTPKAYPTPTSLSVPPPPAPAPIDTGNSGMIEFDLEALSMDPESRSPGELSTEQPDSADDLDDNPLSTKMALAQEFHAIGDTEGARSLIKEVVAEASGPLKARAERFLNELS